MSLAVALLGIAAVLVLTWVGMTRERRELGGSSPASPRAVPEEPAVGEAGGPRAVQAPPDAERASASAPGDALPAADLALLRGSLESDVPGPSPASWRLEVRRADGGAGEVPPMVQAFEGGVQRFELRLPHGDWEVRALAPGLATRRGRARLDAQRTEARVELRFQATGALHGAVIDGRGQPCEGVQVAVRGRDGALERGQTDATGSFVLEGLVAGEYDLLVGGIERPALAPQRASLHGPQAFLAPVVLAEAGAVRVRAIDGRGRPLAGVRVWGHGENGGELGGHTDADGRLVVAHLPRGPWSLEAELEGRRAKRKFLVETGTRAEVEVVLASGGR